MRIDHTLVLTTFGVFPFCLLNAFEDKLEMMIRYRLMFEGYFLYLSILFDLLTLFGERA